MARAADILEAWLPPELGSQADPDCKCAAPVRGAAVLCIKNGTHHGGLHHDLRSRREACRSLEHHPVRAAARQQTFLPSTKLIWRRRASKFNPFDTHQGCPGPKLRSLLGSKTERSPMKAQDIMTRDVITVRPDTSVRDIAAIMVEKHISGVPVLTGNGKLIGMVSQSDLLHRAEVGTERKHKWWFRTFADSNALAREYAKAHGRKAHDIMSRYVVSVRDDAELRDVADILDNHRIKRVPVMQDDRLVGIITRGDLVRALSQVQITKTVKTIDNAALHKTLHDRMRTQSWINDSYINLTVNDGVVELWGFVANADQHSALRALVEETDGVSRVEDNLSVGVTFRAGI